MSVSSPFKQCTLSVFSVPSPQGSDPSALLLQPLPVTFDPLLSSPSCHVTRGVGGLADTGAPAGGPGGRAVRLVDAALYMRFCCCI